MSVAEETIAEARQWQARRYTRGKEKLEENEVVKAKIPSVHKRLAVCCADIAICDLLLGEEVPEVIGRLREAVEWSESYFEELDRHEDEVEGSLLSRRPVALREHMFRAVLARDEGLVMTTVARTETVLADWDIEEYPRTIPAYFHSRALAAHLRDDHDAVSNWTSKMNGARVRTERERAYEQYRRILSRVRHTHHQPEGVTEAIATLLADHHERTDAFRSADDFVCVPATAYAVLAQRAGHDIGLADFADAHDEYLLTPLLE